MTAASIGRRRQIVLRVLSIGASAGLLYALYRGLEVRTLGAVLRAADLRWVGLALVLLALITVLRAARLRWLVTGTTAPGLAEALRLTLVASALNLFVPAKAGDFIKSVAITRQAGTPLGLTTAIVVFERLSDMFGLVAWAVAGLALTKPVAPGVPALAWGAIVFVGAACLVVLVSVRAGDFVSRFPMPLIRGRAAAAAHGLVVGWSQLVTALGSRRFWLIGYALLLWLVQLAQIWVFTRAVGVRMPPATCASLSAIALIVGQLPGTFGGIGARDMAMVLLFRPYMLPEQAAAVGILTSVRNLLPPVAALPFLKRYVSLMLPKA